MPRAPRWYGIPIRTLLLTFVGTLLCFAVSLFLGILGTIAVSALRGVHPDMTFAYRSTQTDPDNITCSLAEKGSLYTGVDSTFMDINLQTMAKGLISGTFSIQLYSSTATVLITQGHFTNVPVTLATQ